MSPKPVAFLMSLTLVLGVQSVASSHRLPDHYVFRATPGLQGYWKVIGSHYNGQAQYPHRENTYWRITRDQIIILIDGQNRGAWTYRFPDRMPGGIDLNNYPSLFELEGAELKVCICQFPDKGARATEFRTQPDSVHVMYHLRRERE